MQVQAARPHDKAAQKQLTQLQRIMYNTQTLSSSTAAPYAGV